MESDQNLQLGNLFGSVGTRAVDLDLFQFKVGSSQCFGSEDVGARSLIGRATLVIVSERSSVCIQNFL